MNPLARYGTKGFLSALVAAQLALVPHLFADTSAERTKVDVKKAGRAFKNDVRKAGRKATGQDNAWDDVKDEAKEAKDNIKDEAEYQAK